MATLTVSVKEAITLNNIDYGSERSLDISSVNEVVKRVVTASTTECGLIGFLSALSSVGVTANKVGYIAGMFDDGDVRYIRITNLDSSNHIMLTFRDEDNTEFRMKVDAGHSFIYPGDNSGGLVDTMKASGSALASGLSDLVDITVDTDTASCDVEVFVGERLMASTYTDIGTELMTTGENAGNWGTKTNTNLKIIEEAVRGYVAQSIAGGADTTALTYTDGSTGDAARNMVIALTGSITGNQVVTVTAKEKVWIVDNQTSGAYTVQFMVSGQTGVTWGTSDKGTKILYCNGTDVIDTGITSAGAFDLDGNELILDADADTSITADTDDQIDIKIAGADDFQFTANTFTAQAGSTIAAQALTATTVTASGIVKTDDTTEATSTTDGSLQTDGGLSVAKDAVFGDDVKLLSDSAVLSFGADSDTTLTHTDGTGLTLNSTNKLLFRDTGLYINSSTDGQLDLVADTEIQIAATTIDINGAIAMDGAITGATNITLSGELDAATLDISGNADIDGTANLDAVDIDGAVQIDNTITVGANDQGYDIIFYGDTASANITWDTSVDDLILNGAARIVVPDGQLVLGSTAVSSTAAELNLLDGLDATYLAVPGKLAGSGFTRSLIVGHSTTGTLSADAVDNTGVGVNALDAITTGDNNTGVGARALSSVSTGANNTAMGTDSQPSVSTGANNTAYGSRSLTTSAGGQHNVAIGQKALEDSTEDYNTAVGSEAGKEISDSFYNITIGYQSGDNITTGDGNVIIGTVDAASATGDRQLMITGYDGTTTTTWIQGDSSGNVTMPAEIAAATLDISGAIDIDGTANLDTVDIDGAVQIDATFTSGVDGQGYDTKFFGDTSSAYIMWDTSADKLLTAGGAVIDIVKDKLLIGGTAVTTTAAELNILDTVTATATELNYSDLTTLGTSAASKVLSADANNLTKITGGVYLEEATLSFDATQDWDVRASPVAKVTLTANVTFDAPSNPTTGQYISIVCIQDGTGSRTIAWNAVFEFASDTAPTATTTASKGDLFTFRYNGSKWLEVGRNLALTLS